MFLFRTLLVSSKLHSEVLGNILLEGTQFTMHSLASPQSEFEVEEEI